MSEEAELAAAKDIVLDTVRRSLGQGGLPLHPLGLHTPPSAGKRQAYVWRSRQAWLGPLIQATERALLLAAVAIVERIASSDAWASPYLDDHRIRLDLTVELDEIDDQAYRLAEVRHQFGQPAFGQPTDEPVLMLDPASRSSADPLTQGWQALVDRVAALSLYANRLLALETELARQAADDRAALIELTAATLAAGAARDELATDHVRALAADLLHRTGPAEITNSETSHRNAT